MPRRLAASLASAKGRSVLLAGQIARPVEKILAMQPKIVADS
jgi:hypothetical protein